jgi:DNA-binding LacI/PurR family transcriptional regulator
MSEQSGRPDRGPSMNDVARHAGVSSQTVSRVANGLENVEESTRRRVLSSMQELGYRPNSAARALRSGRFHDIGVAMFTLSSYGNMRLLDAVAQAASERGYSLTLDLMRETTQRAVSETLTRLLDQGVDGIVIVIEAHLADTPMAELPPGLPVVVIDSTMRTDYPVVDSDQTASARLAVQHLLALGHATVWHVAGPATSYSAIRRRDAWRAALAEAGRAIPEVLQGDWTAESGYRAGRVIAQRDDVTAVFASNDQMALGLMRALHEAGRAVPGEVSVVGCDDTTESASFWPPLTTVHQDFEEQGRRAVRALVAEIERGPRSPDRITVPVWLVERSSTAVPGGSSVDARSTTTEVRP